MLTKKTLAAAIAVVIAGGWVLDAEAQRSGTRIIRYSDPWRMEGYAPPEAYVTTFTFKEPESYTASWKVDLTVSASSAKGFLTDWQEYAGDGEPCGGVGGDCRFVGGVPADYTMSYLQGRLIYPDDDGGGSIFLTASVAQLESCPTLPLPEGPFSIEWRVSYGSSGLGRVTEKVSSPGPILPFIGVDTDGAAGPDCGPLDELTKVCFIEMYAVTPNQLGIGAEDDLLYRLTCPDGAAKLATCYNQTGYTAVTRFSTQPCDGPNCVTQALATGNFGVGTTFFAPEPTSLALLGLGLAGMGFAGRRRGR